MSDILESSQLSLEAAIPMVISKKGIEKEVLLTQAHILLFTPGGSSAALPARGDMVSSLFDPRLALPMLLAHGHYEMAFHIAAAFGLDMTPIFIKFTFELLSTYALPPHHSLVQYVTVVCHFLTKIE